MNSSLQYGLVFLNHFLSSICALVSLLCQQVGLVFSRLHMMDVFHVALTPVTFCVLSNFMKKLQNALKCCQILQVIFSYIA